MEVFDTNKMENHVIKEFFILSGLFAASNGITNCIQSRVLKSEILDIYNLPNCKKLL